jgi:FkbM family methyltransferase
LQITRRISAFLEFGVGFEREPMPDEPGRKSKRPRKSVEDRKSSAYPEELSRTNEEALAQRPFLKPGHEFRPIPTRDRQLRRLKRKHPYFGYVSVEVDGVEPFVMFSNDDDPVAQIYFWFGPNAFESLSLRIWRELVLSSRHILDVGAFTGVYALTAAHANPEARVFCFEPIKGSLNRLMVNLAVNRQVENVRVSDAAVGDTDGTAEMNLFNAPRTMLGGTSSYALLSGSSLVQKGTKEVVAREPVRMTRLDTFVRDHDVDRVDLVKIDVERAEKMVLAGMSDVVHEHRPHLLVEVFSGENLQEVAGMLPSYSFAVIDEVEQSARVDDPEIPDGEARNVLFSPNSAADLRSFCSTFEPLLRVRGA